MLRPKSDIDMLVVNKKLSNSTRKALAEKCADLSDQRTTIGDLEILKNDPRNYTK